VAELAAVTADAPDIAVAAAVSGEAVVESPAVTLALRNRKGTGRKAKVMAAPETEQPSSVSEAPETVVEPVPEPVAAVDASEPVIAESGLYGMPASTKRRKSSAPPHSPLSPARRRNAARRDG
jgi:hypothetical protein